MFQKRTKRPIPLWMARKLVRFASGSLQTACADIDAWFKGESIGEIRWVVIERILTHYSSGAQVSLNTDLHQVYLPVRRVDNLVAATYMLYSLRQKSEAELLRMFIDGPPKPAPADPSSSTHTAAGVTAQQMQNQAWLNQISKLMMDKLAPPPLPNDLYRITADKLHKDILNEQLVKGAAMYKLGNALEDKAP